MKVKKLVKILKAEINAYNGLIKTPPTMKEDEYYKGQIAALSGVISMIEDPVFLDDIGKVWDIK